MDEALREALHIAGGAPVAEGKGLKLSIRFRDPASAEIEFDGPQGPQAYKLKPLGELYGQGTGRESVDLTDDAFLPLLMCIEEAILLEFKHNRRLTDGQALLSLRRLGNDLESDLGDDEVARWIQLRLRLLLSLNDYSRQDVKHALRKIIKSAERHNRQSGTQGYLHFIAEHLPG